MILTNPKVFFAACALMGMIVVSQRNTQVKTMRYLGGEKPKRVDSRPVCSGPRRNRHELREPLYKKAQYGLHFGNSNQYGKINNKLVELSNAVDVAMDSGGKTVVVLSRWAIAAMTPFFPDSESWEQLSRDLPIVKLGAPGLELLEPIKVRTKFLLTRGGPVNLKEHEAWDVIHARRIKLLHYLFSNLEGEPCAFSKRLENHLQETYNQTNYVAVHVRNMEGKCRIFNNNRYAEEQCSMRPSYIKSVMESAGVQDLPIVILSDMQDHAKVHKIQDELDRVVVPEWDFGATPSMIADLVVGTKSDVFLGQQGSSGSRNIGIIREAFGKDVSTNYVFVNKTDDGQWTSFVPHHVYGWWLASDKQ